MTLRRKTQCIIMHIRVCIVWKTVFRNTNWSGIPPKDILEQSVLQVMNTLMTDKLLKSSGTPRMIEQETY